MTADASKPALSTTGCLLRVGVTLAAVLVVIGSGAAGYFLWDQQKHRKALAAEVQAIRDAGEPLDGADLNQMYRLPDGSNDITLRYLAAFAPIQSEEHFARLRQLRNLSTIDETAKEPPHRPETWSRLAEVEVMLRPFQGLCDDLSEAARRLGGVRYPVDFTAGWDADYPQEEAILRCAAALELEALCGYYRADFRRSADMVIALVRLAETLKNLPSVRGFLARNYCAGRCRTIIVFLAFDLEFPVEDLERIQATLADVEYESCALPIFLSERACTYTDLQTPVSEQDAERFELGAGTILYRERPGDSATLLRWCSRSVEVAKLPLPNALREARTVMQAIEAEQAAGQRLPVWMQNHVSQRDYLFPGFFLSRIADAETMNRALVTFCAVERFRRNRQELPGSLAELCPDFLDAVPTDPRTLQPLRYQQTVTYYSIYGVGTDEKDGGGPTREKMEMHDFGDEGVVSFYRLPPEETLKN